MFGGVGRRGPRTRGAPCPEAAKGGGARPLWTGHPVLNPSGDFLPVSRAISPPESSPRPCSPRPPAAPRLLLFKNVLIQARERANWGLRDGRGQLPHTPPACPHCRGVNKTLLVALPITGTEGATGPDRGRDCPPAWGELGSPLPSHGAGPPGSAWESGSRLRARSPRQEKGQRWPGFGWGHIPREPPARPERWGGPLRAGRRSWWPRGR